MTQGIVVVDVETNGLDFFDPKTVLLEVALVAIPDGSLTDLSAIRSTSIVLHQGEEAYNHANGYVQQMHTNNGLWEECQASGVSLSAAQDHLASFLDDVFGHPDAEGYVAPLFGGNSQTLDRAMLLRDMPEVARRLHYRLLDASCLRTAEGLWPRRREHRALDDAKNCLSMLLRHAIERV